MNINIGLKNLNETVLEELSKIQTTQFKIGVKGKKDNLMGGPEILQTFIIGLGNSAAWDMLKIIFSILRTYSIKMVPTNTELGKIGSIYIEGPVTIIQQGNNSFLISNEDNSKKLIIKDNFEIIER